MIGRAITHGCGATITIGAAQMPAGSRQSVPPVQATTAGARPAPIAGLPSAAAAPQTSVRGAQTGQAPEKVNSQSAVAEGPTSPAVEAEEGLPRWFWASIFTTLVLFAGLGLFIVRNMLESGRRQAIVRANAEVEKKLEEARQALASGDLAAAEKLAREADAIPDSTLSEKGSVILADVAVKRAIAKARESIAAKRFDEAKVLLESRPSTAPSRATAAEAADLLQQLLTATLPERAAELADTLSDAEAKACVENGTLPPGKSLSDAALNAELVDACGRALVAIRAKREAERRRADIGREFVAFRPMGGTHRMAVSGDGRFVASIDGDKNRVVVQTTTDGDVTAKLTPPPGRKLDVLGTCCLSPDGSAAAAVVANDAEAVVERRFVAVWDVSSGRITASCTGISEATGFSDYLDAVALSSEHVIAPATSRKGFDEKAVVRVWNRSSSGLAYSFVGHRKRVKAIAVHDGRGLVATGGEDRVVIVWDAATGREVAVLDDHESEIEALAFSPDGTRIASGGFECSVRLWDIADRKLQFKWQLGLYDAQKEAKMRMDEMQRQLQSRIDSLSGNARLSVSALASWPYPRVSSVAFSSDGGRIVVGFHAPVPQSLAYKTNPVLIDLASRNIVPLPAAFLAEPLRSVNAAFVRGGDAVMFNKVVSERVRGEVKSHSVLSVTGIP